MFHLFHKKFFLFSLNEIIIDINKKIRLIGRAEASDLGSALNVSLPASRPTMEQRQEAQGDFAFEGPAA